MLNCRGGGQAVQGSVSPPPQPPGYQSKIILVILLILKYLNVEMYQSKNDSSQIQMFSLSHCFVCLVDGVWGKLSSAV